MLPRDRRPMLRSRPLRGERIRPHDFKAVGAGLALLCAALFAVRDNLVRWVARDGGDYQVLLFDLLGHKLADLGSHHVDAGGYWEWDGTVAGVPVASRQYWVLVTGSAQTQRFALLVQ